uniref:Si:dkey-199f5.8 n=1 Tax=Oryzias sinensis TaxID=183150 RepID=A0A8C7YD74_9TELE
VLVCGILRRFRVFSAPLQPRRNESGLMGSRSVSNALFDVCLRKMLEPRMMTLSPPFLPPQAGNYTFNRAKLMNIGFREAMREEDWDCLFFHDVDLIPEDDRNTYICDANPKHAAIAMDKFGYKLPYNMYFGGVSALSPLQYLKMNGFPNNYWGWGGEDDDIGIRVSLAGMHISRPPLKHGRYKMIKHKLDQGNDVNPKRFNMLAKTRQTWKLDGMNSLEYEVVSREYLPLYANITVDIGTEKGLKPPPLIPSLIICCC